METLPVLGVFFQFPFDSTLKEEQTLNKRQFHGLDPEDRVMVEQSAHPIPHLP